MNALTLTEDFQISDGERNAYKVALASVRGGVVDEPGYLSLDDSYCKHVIATGREFAVDRSNAHPLVCNTMLATTEQVVSYLGVPIASRDGIIVGVLCVHTTDEREWSTADVSMLTQLSFVLTRALEPSPA